MSINNLPNITKAVKIAEQIRRIKRNEIEGFSMSSRNLEPAPHVGYMVGTRDDEFNAADMDNNDVIMAIVKILEQGACAYVVAQRTSDAIGVKGMTKFSRRSVAEQMGRKRKQIAIYDLKNQCDINLMKK